MLLTVDVVSAKGVRQVALEQASITSFVGNFFTSQAVKRNLASLERSYFLRYVKIHPVTKSDNE